MAAWVLWLWVSLCAVWVPSAAVGQSQAGDAAETMAKAWATMRRADIGSAQYVQAAKRLRESINQWPASRRMEGATALMDRYAPDNVNAAAPMFFGRDPFTTDEIRAVLFDQGRSRRQRVLIRTYFTLCRADYRHRQLSEERRLALVGLLAERLEGLLGTAVGYGEQRLLTHCCQSVLTRYGRRSGQTAEARRLIAAMKAYAASEPAGDTFAASARGWLGLIANPSDSISSADQAEAWLGHWDPLARWRAHRYLGAQMSRRQDVAEKVWRRLADVRDEVRAAAVMAFTVAEQPEAGKVVDKLVGMLIHDRGVIVQAAASVALATQGESARVAVGPLLAAFELPRGKPVPGIKRTDSILLALASLAGYADEGQKQRMLELAVEKLSRSPLGSLELLKALGPAARSALREVKAYGRDACRPERHYIDRHVVPAITFGRMALPE